MRRILATSVTVARQQGLAALATQGLEKLNRHEFRIVEHSVPDSEYQAWIVQNEPDEAALAEQKTRAGRMPYRPLISLVTPVWNPPANVLRETIRSVISQTYDNWELCLAATQMSDEARTALMEFGDDARIKVKSLDKNLGVSGNTNEAIQFSQGEFIALLDQDDVLAPFALFEIARCLNSMPELDFIYSDMDRLDAKGRRFDPLFKPDWSPEIMLCANYIVHLSTIRASLLRKLGGFRASVDRAQDWDLILRLMEVTDRIHHIPKVLYHWRWSPISVATAGFRVTPASREAQRLAISEYLSRNSIHAKLMLDRTDCWRALCSYAAPSVSIVLSSHSDNQALHDCLESLFSETNYPNFEVNAIMDRNTTIQDSRVRLVHTERALGQAEAYNLGAKGSKGEVIVFLDAHVEVRSSNWLQELVGWALQPWIGVVGPKLMHPDMRHIAHCGIVLGLQNFLFNGAAERTWTPLGLTEWYRNCSAVSGACLATRRGVFESIGGFDEDLPSAADIAYCLEAWEHNLRIMCTPVARLVLHKPSQHIPDQDPIRNRCAIHGDPYFNPNLSYAHPVPKLKNTSRNRLT